MLKLLAVLGIGLMGVGGAVAQTCSNESLNGAYSFTSQGVILDGAGFPASQVGSFASFGTAAYDGNGGVVVNGQASFNGGMQTLSGVKGAYAVNGDCTFTSKLDNGNAYFGVITWKGDELLMQQMTPGTVISGSAMKQVRSAAADPSAEAAGGSCDQATFSGSYGVLLTGYFGPPAAPLPFLVGPESGVGILKFDPSGTLSITAVVSINGLVDSATLQALPGTYTLSSNCELKMKAAVGIEISGQVVTSGRALQGLETNPGTAITVKGRSIN